MRMSLVPVLHTGHGGEIDEGRDGAAPLRTRLEQQAILGAALDDLRDEALAEPSDVTSRRRRPDGRGLLR